MATMYKVKDGEVVQPRMKRYRMGCCDCGLVHNMDFKVFRRLKNGRARYLSARKYGIHFRAWRNNRSTANVRRGYSGVKFHHAKA